MTISSDNIDLLDAKIAGICYSFYRYEINTGMVRLNDLIFELLDYLSKKDMEEERLKEINQLLELVQQAVENKDYLIAADVLKYELIGRMQ